MIAENSYQLQAGLTPSTELTVAGRKTNKHLFLKTHVQKHKVLFIVVLSAGLISSCAGFFLTLSIGDFFMLSFNTGSSKGKLLSMLGIRLETINTFFLVFLAAAFAKLISGFIEKYFSVQLAEKFVKDIRQQVFAAQVKTDEVVFKQKPYGNYLLRYSNDMKAVQTYLVKGILGGVGETFVVLLGFYILLQINLQLASMVFILFSVITILISVVAGWQKKYIAQSRNRRSSLLAFVAKNFARFSVMKKEAKEEGMISRFEKKSADLYQANMENGKIETVVSSMIPFLHYLVIAIVLVVIAKGLVTVQAADGLVIILVLMLMQGAVKRLLKVPGILNKGRISLDKIAELMETSAGK